MAQDEFRKLPPKTLADDLDVFNTLKGMDGYVPANPAYALTALTALNTARLSTGEIKAQAAAAHDTARDNEVAAQWAFHNGILGAKAQVAAQFGPDSNEVQAMGLKKKNERKRPKRQPPQAVK